MTRLARSLPIYLILVGVLAFGLISPGLAALSADTPPTPPDAPHEPTDTPEPVIPTSPPNPTSPPGSGDRATDTPRPNSGPFPTRTPSPTVTPENWITATLTSTPTATPVFTYLYILIYLDANEDGFYGQGEGVEGLWILVRQEAIKNIAAWSAGALTSGGEVTLVLPETIVLGSEVQVQIPYLHHSQTVRVSKDAGGTAYLEIRLEPPHYPVLLP